MPLHVRLVEQLSDALRVTVGTRVRVEVNVVLALALSDRLTEEVYVGTKVDDTNRVRETLVLKDAVGPRVTVLVRLLLGVRSRLGVTDAVHVGTVVTDAVHVGTVVTDRVTDMVLLCIIVPEDVQLTLADGTEAGVHVPLTLDTTV